MQAYIELPHGTIITTDNPKVYDGPFLNGKRLSQREGKIGLKIQAAASLLGLLNPKDTVYTVLRHVSASGMSRHIDLYIIKDNQPLWITGSVATLLNLKRAKGQGLIVSGCGMDMGFATVYNLGSALWPNGTEEPHGTRNGQPDHDGGYALKSVWL
jgi:hypothetical protein